MKSELKIFPDSTKEWKLNELPNGSKFWYLNDKLHRKDGPAVELFDGTKAWFWYGKCHREDGPAIEYNNGIKQWWVNDKLLTEEQLLSEEIKINYPELYSSYIVHQVMGS